MKKKILVLLFVLSLSVPILSTTKQVIFAQNTSTLHNEDNYTQNIETQNENTEDNIQSENQEPKYIGSIKVSEKNSEDKINEQKIWSNMARISENSAKEIALAKVSGTVVKISLDNENGYLVYSVEIKEPQGKIFDVKVDAGNNKILSIETSEEQEKEKENNELLEETKKESPNKEK